MNEFEQVRNTQMMTNWKHEVLNVKHDSTEVSNKVLLELMEYVDELLNNKDDVELDDTINDLQGEVSQLEEERDDLDDLVKALREENTELESFNASLLDDVMRLEEEIKELAIQGWGRTMNEFEQVRDERTRYGWMISLSDSKRDWKISDEQLRALLDYVTRLEGIRLEGKNHMAYSNLFESGEVCTQFDEDVDYTEL